MSWASRAFSAALPAKDNQSCVRAAMVSAASTPVWTLASAIARDRLARRFDTIINLKSFNVSSRAGNTSDHAELTEDGLSSAPRQVWSRPTFGPAPKSGERLDAVLDKTGALSHRIIEPARVRVCLMRIPEDARGAHVPCRRGDSVDQRPSHASAPLRRAHVEVLQITARVDEPGRALEEIVREADQLIAARRDDGVDRLQRVEDALPGRVGHLRGLRCSIEVEIGSP